MAKFSKAFRGVPAGKIYPQDYAAGDDCPPELEAAARDAGALSAASKPAKQAKAEEAGE